MPNKHLTYCYKLLNCAGCEGAPLLPLLFVLVNMGFNISLLHLLKISSAVISSLASTFSGFHTVLSAPSNLLTSADSTSSFVLWFHLTSQCWVLPVSAASSQLNYIIY
jgi:hypothetical protein